MCIYIHIFCLYSGVYLYTCIQCVNNYTDIYSVGLNLYTYSYIYLHDIYIHNSWC